MDFLPISQRVSTEMRTIAEMAVKMVNGSRVKGGTAAIWEFLTRPKRMDGIAEIADCLMLTGAILPEKTRGKGMTASGS